MMVYKRKHTLSHHILRVRFIMQEVYTYMKIRIKLNVYNSHFRYIYDKYQDNAIDYD